MCSNQHESSNLVTFTEEIRKGKLHFLCNYLGFTKQITKNQNGNFQYAAISVMKQEFKIGWFHKKEKPKYLENETLKFIQIKKIIIYQGLLYNKKRFVAEVILNHIRKKPTYSKALSTSNYQNFLQEGNPFQPNVAFHIVTSHLIS